MGAAPSSKTYAKPSPKSYPKPSMLHFAAFTGNDGLFPIYLKEHEVDLLCSIASDGRGIVMTPLMCAVREGHEKAVMLLLKAGANPSAVSPDTGMSVLYHTAERGHANIITILLAAGAVIDSIDHEGRTTLYLAALLGFDKVVRILISTHANLDIANKEGLTALIAAADRGHENCVRYLLNAGADFTKAALKDGYTCLDVACGGGSVAVVKLLLDWDVPVDINVAPVDGRTASSLKGVSALYVAARHGSVDIIRILLHAGADVNWKSKEGCTSLHAAAFLGHYKAVKALITAGAMLDIVDDKGRTPLMSASCNGKDKCVRLLLKAGADISKASTDDRMTALHVAASGGEENVVKTLLRWKADVHAKEFTGCTPLGLAAEFDHRAEPSEPVPYTFSPRHRMIAAILLEILRRLLKRGLYCCAWILMKVVKIIYYGAVNLVFVGYIIFQLMVLVFIHILKVVDYCTGLDIVPSIRNYIDKVNSEAADNPPEAGRKDATDAAAVTFKLCENDVDKARVVNLSDLVPYERESDVHVRSTACAAVGSVYSEIDQDTLQHNRTMDEVYVEEKQHKVQQPCLNCQTQTHRRCGGCKISFFCSRVCQKATYKDHKPICLEICEEKRRARAEREARKAEAHTEVE